jgi:glycine oxidase
MAGSPEIAVAGAGLIGSSIAWRLAQAGAQVVLIDAGVFGGEASSAGAGMLSPGGEFEAPSRWLDWGVESMRMYGAFVDELRQETGTPIDFAACGSTYFVGDAEQARGRAAFQSSAGIRVEIEPARLQYPDDAYVNPSDLLRALRCACEKRGVRIREREPLQEIDATRYRGVVIAAGAWSNAIHVCNQGALPVVKPIKGHLLGFQLEPGSLGAMLRRGHAYVLQRASGFTVAGSNEEDAGFDRSIDDAACREIHRHAAELFPPLENAVPCRRWIGFRPFSENGPHIGRVAGSNVWLAYGHYRNGILLTPLTSRRIAAEITS